MSKQHYQAGFTLLELLITLAILTVISVLAIPAYTGYVKTSRANECAQEAAVIEFALASFMHDRNAYFYGNNPVVLQANSFNYYVPSPRFANGTANCNMAVNNPGGVNQYEIVATGVNDLAAEGVIMRKRNF